MKKLALVLCILFVPAVQAINIYQILDKIGYCMDFIYSKGRLSEGDEKLFKEVACSLGIENREIKPRNSGLLLRLLGGYNNALAVQMFNRVYLNASCLEKMSDGQKRFLMAHELSHHKRHDQCKLVALKVLNLLISFEINQSLQSKNNLQGHSSIYYRYLFEGFTIPIICELSLKSLVVGQILQNIEIEADKSAICKGGATVEDGKECLQQLYYPDTNDWPLYAKISNAIQQLFLPIWSLPIIKEHMPHLCSFEDRISRLSAIK